MGSFSLFAVSLLLLLLVRGNDAARLYPTRQKSNNETSFSVQLRLLQGLADTNESENIYTYGADHQMQTGEYYGVSVTMDVYDFELTDDQNTLAGVYISNKGDGAASSLSFIQIGWQVSPGTYGGDSRAHLFGLWTAYGPEHSCVNTDCPIGFQPEAGAPIALGDVIEPVSQPTGAKQSITIKVLKDSASGDWLVHYGFNQGDPKLIGRYPKSLFTGGLADRATHINIGGAVLAGNTGLVPMGSGYLPTNDSMAMATAASFSNIEIINQNGKAASLLDQDFPGLANKPDTYSASPVINGRFFYGGPYRTTT